MTATSTKNTKISLSGAASTFVSLIPTAISKAKPAVVTVASVTGLTAGDLVKIPAGGTGFSELDGQTFIVGVVNTGPNTFTLLGSNTTGSTGTLVGSPTLSYAPVATMSSMTCTLREFTINVETPGTISAATFCDPSATIPNTIVQAGTVSIVGNIDILDAGYTNLLTAVDDGLERILKVELPSNGYLTAPVIVSSIGWSVPIDGIQDFNGQFTLKSKFKHRY